MNAGGREEIRFDEGWLFHLGEVAGGEKPGLDDKRWRRLDLPHDWSIEDLPARREPGRGRIVDLTRGTWRWRSGDDPRWRLPGANEAGWEEGTLPRHVHPSIGPLGPKSYGWYRTTFTAPRAWRRRGLALDVGKADDVDEAFLNGVKIGGHGGFPPRYRTAYFRHRLYAAPSRLVRWGRENHVAVRVYSGRHRGGLFRAGGRGRSGPFDSEAPGGPGTAHAVGGVGWYRKRFRPPLSARGRRVLVEFDGVYMNSTVWLNGRRLGDHPNGYTPFRFDLTGRLDLGGENVLAVKVRNLGHNSRWYSGSGIYRSVKLSVLPPVHVAPWGVFVSTERASRRAARVRCAISLGNASGRRVRAAVLARLVDADGRTAAEGRRTVSVRPCGEAEAVVRLAVRRPRLWSPRTPHRYVLRAEVVMSGAVVDAVEAPCGVRTLEFDAKRGFRLNGTPTLLKGACMHHDNGPLGAVALERADERRVERMKAEGYNAVRTAHNPPSAGFLDACDRLGMMVIDEAFDQWNVGSTDDDYHRFFKAWWKRDVSAMVLRDRNRPSVIMWSIGNEIGEQASALGLETARKLAGRIRELDRTRPVTQGVNSRAPTWRHLDGLFGVLDVCGYNYKVDQYAEDHERFPKRVMFASESFADRADEYWAAVKRHPWVIGDFVWTGYDYLGEAGIGATPDWVYNYPWTAAYCGDLDLIGHKRPASYYRDAVWNPGPRLSLFVHVPRGRFNSPLAGNWSFPEVLDSWTWPGREGRRLRVVAYTSCDRVALTLNGRSLGTREVGPENRLRAEWDVPYAPGRLVAVGFRRGRKVAMSALETAGTPRRLVLRPDRREIRADGRDLCYVDVEIVDAKGRRHPHADHPVRFEVEGAGTLAAVGSANPMSTESFRRSRRRAWEGRCQAVVRAARRPGSIRVTASSAGLAGASVDVSAGPATVKRR